AYMTELESIKIGIDISALEKHSDFLKLSLRRIAFEDQCYLTYCNRAAFELQPKQKELPPIIHGADWPWYEPIMVQLIEADDSPSSPDKEETGRVQSVVTAHSPVGDKPLEKKQEQHSADSPKSPEIEQSE